MRLPTRTKRQQQQEEARVFHEAIWSAHLEQQRIRVPPGRLQAVWSVKGRDFWNPRGFAFKTHRIAEGYELWIEPLGVGIQLKKCLRAKPEAA